MPNIKIKLQEKRLSFFDEEDENIEIIGDNNDYYFTFDIDEPRNAMFAVFSDSERQSEPILLDESGTVNVPLWLMKRGEKHVGLISDGFASAIKSFYVKGSIAQANDPLAEDIEPEIAEQLIRLVNELKSQELTDEDIANAVSEYLERNPIEAGINETTVLGIVENYLAENPPMNGAKGDKGDPFTYADFTPEQLEALKGADGESYVLTENDKAEIAEEVKDNLSLKTINNQSLLGEGNISIEGGSGSGNNTVLFQTEVDDGVLKVYQDENDTFQLSLNDGVLVAECDNVERELGAVSAYAIAVEHGYNGTEEQWLQSLKGETGDSYILTESDKTEIAEEVTEGLSFKTINNQSILGEGNISIESSAGESRDEVEFIKTIEISESDVASITVDLENYYKKVFITNSEFEVYDNIESSIVTAGGVKIWLKKDGNSIFNFSYNFVLNTGIAPVPRRGYNITIDLSPPLLRFYVEQYLWSGGLIPSSGNGNSKVTILSNSLRDCFDTVELQTIGDGRFVQNAKLHFWGVKK